METKSSFFRFINAKIIIDDCPLHKLICAFIHGRVVRMDLDQ